MANTKYGKQPFLDVIRDTKVTFYRDDGSVEEERNVSYREAAALLGVPYLHFRHAGYGYVVPKYELREALAEFLGLPESELFTEEVLAKDPHYGPRGKRLMTETPEEKAARIKQERADKAARRAARELSEVS